MLYELLRVAARFALRWHYAEIIVQGREHVPAHAPVLVVANHPNALVDAMIVGTTVRRRVLITARATLFEGRFMSRLLEHIGVVPLLRVQDVPALGGSPAFLTRNDASLARVTDALHRGEVVLIFPEGISHDGPAMTPLKSGAARIALQARSKGTSALQILPVGMVYEQKERPGSRVLVRVGQPIDIDAWCAQNQASGAPALTQEIALALHRVTLNFASEERALRSIQIAHSLAALRGVAPSAGGSSFDDAVHIAGRIENATEALEQSPPELREQADRFTAELQRLEANLTSRGITLRDALVSTSFAPGLVFALREAALAVTLLPIALAGRVFHWLPLHAARRAALHSLRFDESRDQPAMRTILINLASLPVWYALQAVLISTVVGGLWALTAVSVFFLGANIDARYRERLWNAVQRARAYVAYRDDASFHAAMVADAHRLLGQAAALESTLLRLRAGTI